MDHTIVICSKVFVGMVYFGCYLVIPHVQPLFTQKALVPLCIAGFSAFMAHLNISLRF